MEEVDFFATEGEHKGNIKDDGDKLTFNIMRTGSTWTRVATFWTGKTDDRPCQLCLEEEDTADHVWKCRRLKEKARGLDKELAEIDPDKLTNSMRIGVAPAMDGDTRVTHWGTEPDESWSKETKQMMGCYSNEPNGIVKRMTANVEKGMSARMVMQGLIAAPERRGDAGRTKV